MVETVGAGKLQVVPAGAEHGGGLAAESLRCRLGDRVECCFGRQRLAQHRRDPVETAFDLRLARALLVRFGVAQRHRRQAREAFDQPEVRLVEPIRLERADSQDAERLPERQDRSVHHLFEDRVVRRRRRLLGGGEVTPEDRPAGRDRLADRAGRRDPAADLRLGKPDDRPTDQLTPVRRERPAVGRVAVHQRAHLVDEPVDHDVDAKIARQRLAGLEQRLLLGEPAIALAEQPARVDGDRGLQRDGLCERDLGPCPASRLRPVQAQHPDHPVERDDRGCQHGADAAICQLADVAEGRVVQLGGLKHVAHGDGSALAHREVHRGQPARVAERWDSGCRPLRKHRRRLARFAEADEAALDVGRVGRLLDCDLEQLVEVAARPDGTRDPCDQAFPLECVRDRIRRARALERETGLGGEGLHQHELVEVEEPRTTNRGEDDADHVAASTHRNKGAALDVRDVVQPLVHDRRALGVVHRERGAFANDRADAGDLLAQRDGLAEQLLVVLAALPCGDDDRSPAVVLDDREVRDIQLEEPGQLVQEDPRDRGRPVGVEQLMRKAADSCDLAVAA